MITKILAVLVSIISGGKVVLNLMDKYSKIVEPLIREVEARAKDGVIDKADRKAIVLRGVRILENRKLIKFNWFTRWLLDIVIDKVAKKQPNYNVSIEAKSIISCLIPKH